MSYKKRVAIFLVVMTISGVALVSAFVWQLRSHEGADDDLKQFTDEFVEESNTQNR